MSEIFLSRARLDANFDRLAPLLFPRDGAQRLDATHRLVWSMFPRELQTRPFLYRENDQASGPGLKSGAELMILSRLAPTDGEGLFTVETKIFKPVLAARQKLGFSLRANPVVSRNVTLPDGRVKAVRRDVVMEALFDKKDRAVARPEQIRLAGLAWLKNQAAQAGFALPDDEAVAIDGYEQVAIDPSRRGFGKQQGVHSRLDFSGMLEVRDPDLFLARLVEGFGRARAFGHGLMLIRKI